MAKAKVEMLPYGGDPNIVVKWELPFGKEVIKPGDKIKFKNVRDTFVFKRVCSHLVTESVWIDCLSDSRKSFHSLPVDKLKGVLRPKKSRKKKRK